jgi:hypothetical protein
MGVILPSETVNSKLGWSSIFGAPFERVGSTLSVPAEALYAYYSPEQAWAEVFPHAVPQNASNSLRRTGLDR